MNARSLSLITGLAAGLALVPSAHAITGCTNSWLTGNFGMQFSGTSAPGVAGGIGGIPVPPSMAAEAASSQINGSSGTAPTAGVARLYLDGAGSMSGYSSVNLEGVWLQGNITGTYNVNVDCTASFTVTDAAGNTEHFGGILVGQGDSAMVLQTDAGTGVSGVLKRIRGFCQTSDVFGSFGLQYAGTVVGTTNSPYSSVGIVSLDGQGNASSNESRYSGGSYAQVASNGTITINPDCTAVLTLSTVGGASAAAMNFLGIVSFDQKQLFLVQSDAGTATTGSFVAQ